MENETDVKYKTEGVAVKGDENHMAVSTSRDDLVLKDEAIFECVACTICFKSGKACANHEKSRKHKENVRFLERQLEEGIHEHNAANDQNGCREDQITMNENEESNDVTMLDEEELSHSLLMRCSSLTLPSYIVKRNVIKRRGKSECDRSEGRTEFYFEDEKQSHAAADGDSEFDSRQFVILNEKMESLSIQKDEQTNCDIVFHCTACNKFFKSEKACQNHVKSKRHKDNVQMIENELERCSHREMPQKDFHPIVSLTLDAELVSKKDLDSNKGTNEQEDESDEEDVIYEYARHGSLSLPANIVKRNIIKKISASK